MLVLLEPILNHVPAWLLVFFRLSGLFIFGPVFASPALLLQVKIFLAFTLSLCVYPVLITPGAGSEPGMVWIVTEGLSLWTLAPMIAMELLIGALLGYGVALPLMGMQMGGKIIDQQMGLAVAGVFNPELQTESGVVSEFLFMMAVAIFVLIGGHRAVVAVLVGSFDHVPPGGFLVTAGVVDLAVGLLASMFDLALRIAAPLLCLIFLETVAMGFVARTVPQMNVLSIGFAVRIAIGTLLLIVSVVAMAGLFEDRLVEHLEVLRAFLTTTPEAGG